MEDNELKQFANSVGQTTDRLVGTGNRLIEAIDKSSRSQEKHQKAIVGLTIVIAFSTVVYTCLTVWSTLLQHKEFELNQIKSEQSQKAGHGPNGT